MTCSFASGVLVGLGIMLVLLVLIDLEADRQARKYQRKHSEFTPLSEQLGPSQEVADDEREGDADE